jgi:hypothetical protein
VTSDYEWEAPIYWPTVRWEDAMPGHEFSTLSREASTRKLSTEDAILHSWSHFKLSLVKLSTEYMIF